VSEANRLKDSASPYLRSAAHQPVDWNEWGDAAFAKARAEGKPILLDIGAVWCHWCHVIDRESYENEEIAALINRLYVAVKVDRDERPDVDARYQAAISAISGQGGWPLTAFLTPDGKPFFGGTYFPPEDAMGRPGFKRILASIAEAFAKRRAEVDTSAKALEEAVAQAELFREARGTFDASVVETMVGGMTRLFDERNGGFGQAPKFPHSSALDLLLDRQKAAGTGSELRAIAKKTLDAMAAGGVYDQLGGGFHRYSVDERWRVPHFEKMSYDNSELLKNYLHGWQVFRKPAYRRVAEGIIGWVTETLSDQERGGFYASQDADQTLEDDGDYFTWTRAEVRAALAPEEARVAELAFDVEERGEMHHNPAKNVLWLARTPEEIAQETGMDEAGVRLTLARASGKLLEARRRRPAPAVDTTIYAGWNAMFVSAFLEAARVLGRADCGAFARKTLDRLVEEGWDARKGFAHRIGAASGAAAGPRLEGSLDDQVFGAAALLDAYEATLERGYFEKAERTAEIILEKYGDAEGGGFFDRATDAAPLGGLDIRRKPLQDSPTPGANAAAAIVLDRLYGLTGKALYRERAEKTLEAFAGIAPQYGLFAATYALAATLHARHPLQVVITGAAGDPKAAALEQAALATYRFGKAVLRVTPEQLAAGGLAPALAETIPHLDAGKAQALVCVETSCRPPVTEPAQLMAILSEAAAGAIAG
jgi:hypothetical protein